MAASSAPYTPAAGTGLYLMAERWQQRIEDTVYDLQAFIPTIRETERLYNKLHIRKLSRFASSTLAQSDSGIGLTYNVNSEVEVTLTPAGSYVATVYSANFDAQTDMAADAEFRMNCEDALAEAMDAAALADVANCVTNDTGAYGTDVDAAALRNAVAGLSISARSKAQPGKTLINGVFHSSQWAALMSIPEVTHADIIGDGQAILRSGLIVKALALTIKFTNQTNAGGGVGTADNSVHLREGYAIGYNQRPTVKVQDVELQNRIIVFANYGHAQVHDVRCARVKSKAAL